MKFRFRCRMTCLLLLAFIIFPVHCNDTSTESAFNDNSVNLMPSDYLLLDDLDKIQDECILRGRISKEIGDLSFQKALFPGFGIGHTIQGRNGMGFMIGELVCVLSVPAFFALSGLFSFVAFSSGNLNEFNSIRDQMIWPVVGVSAGIFLLFKISEVIDVAGFPEKQNKMYDNLMGSQ